MFLKYSNKINLERIHKSGNRFCDKDARENNKLERACDSKNRKRALVSASIALITSMTISMATAAYDGMVKTNSPFKITTENGVKVWRAQPQKRREGVTPALLGDEPVNIVSEVNIEKEVIIKPRTRPANVRVIGHFSGYGKRIPFVQGFYSGYPRSKTSRSYRQGFYSGYRTNKKRRFPLERPNGFRRSK